MIQLPANIQPDQVVLDQLNLWQNEITGDFSEQSAKAKKLFKKKNTKSNRTFREVKKALTSMCSGARRCVYCEDSVGDEVEHIYPKDLYPEKTFEWENYVYACGNCNSPKRNKFAVFKDDDGQLQLVNPPHWPAGTPPPPGKAVMINPRTDNPLNYAVLDIKSTFMFQPNPDADSSGKKQFEYTYEDVLQLNHSDREFLRQAREEAYGDYKARLTEYDKQKKQGANQAKLDKLVSGILKKNHPTVWREMQRWHEKGWLAQSDPDLNQLFLDNSEALNW